MSQNTVNRVADIKRRFAEAFDRHHEESRVVCSPLRVCPLGAHVDHQLGLVCGFALDEGLLLAFAPNDRPTVRLRSLDFDGQVEFDLDEIPSKAEGDWGDYARGAAEAVRTRYELRRGIDGLVAGSLPTGGLGSSAAVGVAYLLALEFANGLDVSPDDNVRLDQYTENVYLGLNNGVLDQSMNLLSAKDRLLFMDCESGEYRLLSLPPDARPFKIVVAYSGFSDALTSTDYNKRVGECQEAARRLLEAAGESLPRSEEVKLRAVTESIFKEYAASLPDNLRKRATHFFTENQRVRDGIAAWESGDLQRFGALMTQSGGSSIESYECGRPELITMYETLIETPGILGARFSGAGFRGSCVALSEEGAEEDIRERVLGVYGAKHPDAKDKCAIYFCETDDGARIV